MPANLIIQTKTRSIIVELITSIGSDALVALKLAMIDNQGLNLETDSGRALLADAFEKKFQEIRRQIWE